MIIVLILCFFSSYSQKFYYENKDRSAHIVMVDNKLVAKVEPGKEFNQPISKGNHTFTVLRAKDNMVLGSESVNVS